MGHIYKITNLINGKIYIGKTIKTPEKRWQEHIRKAKQFTNRYLYDAMNHYGYDNFKIESIEECLNEELDKREIYWINYYDSYNKGYNMTLGGEGGDTWSKNNNKEKTSKKLSKALKGRKFTAEHRKNISKALKGKHYLTFTKQQLLDALLESDSMEEVCERCGCKRKTVYDRCKEYFNKTPREVRGKSFTPTSKIKIDKELLLQKINEDLTLEELASFFNVSRETIRRRIKEYFNKTITELKNDKFKN